MADLITAPTFTFKQGDIFTGDTNVEYPIQVIYYKDTICLEQNGNSINIISEKLSALVKEIKNHLPEATSYIESKNKK